MKRREKKERKRLAAAEEDLWAEVEAMLLLLMLLGECGCFTVVTMKTLIGALPTLKKSCHGDENLQSTVRLLRVR